VDRREVTKRARAGSKPACHRLWVRGEIAGFKACAAATGTSPCATSRRKLRCVMFAKQNFMLPTPSDGMQVFVFARPSMYEEKGEFQLTVTELPPPIRAACGSWHSEKAKAR